MMHKDIFLLIGESVVVGSVRAKHDGTAGAHIMVTCHILRWLVATQAFLHLFFQPLTQVAGVVPLRTYYGIVETIEQVAEPDVLRERLLPKQLSRVGKWIYLVEIPQCLYRDRRFGHPVCIVDHIKTPTPLGYTFVFVGKV